MLGGLVVGTSRTLVPESNMRILRHHGRRMTIWIEGSSQDQIANVAIIATPSSNQLLVTCAGSVGKKDRGEHNGCRQQHHNHNANDDEALTDRHRLMLPSAPYVGLTSRCELGRNSLLGGRQRIKTPPWLAGSELIETTLLVEAC